MKKHTTIHPNAQPINNKYPKPAESNKLNSKIGFQSKAKKNEKFTGNSFTETNLEYFPKNSENSEIESSNQNKNKLEADEERTKASKDKSHQSSVFGTRTELESSVDKIQNELEEKIREIEEMKRNGDKRKSEIIELHKNISYLQGQIEIKDRQLLNYELSLTNIATECDEKSKHKSEVKELVGLFEGMRRENEHLNGKYREKGYQLNKLTEKYIKLKEKACRNNLLREEPKRIVSRSNSLKSSSTSLIKKLQEPCLKDKGYRNSFLTLQDKILAIETNLSCIMSENEKLFEQLEEKDELIKLLNKNNLDLRTHSEKISTEDEAFEKINKTSSNKTEGEVKQSSHKHDKDLLKESSISQEPFKPPNKNARISLIIKKLRYNLISSEKTYEDLLETLSNIHNNQIALIQTPYNLNMEETNKIMEWIDESMMKHEDKNPSNGYLVKQSSISDVVFPKEKIKNFLRKKLVKFNNLTLEKQHCLKIIIFKEFMNREFEFYQTINHNPIADCFWAEDFFKNWGLNAEEIDVIFKTCYDLAGELKWINLENLRVILSSWEAL